MATRTDGPLRLSPIADLSPTRRQLALVLTQQRRRGLGSLRWFLATWFLACLAAFACGLYLGSQ